MGVGDLVNGLDLIPEALRVPQFLGDHAEA